MTTRAVHPPRRTSWAPGAALGLAMLMVTSEMTIPAVTLTGRGADLGVSAAATAWVVPAYVVVTAAVGLGLVVRLVPASLGDARRTAEGAR